MSLGAANMRGVSWASVSRFGAGASSSATVRALVGSRLLVLLAGSGAAIAVPRVDGWEQFDPSRISSSFGWLGNALTAPAVRWDSIHYLQIAAHGYSAAANSVFLPLYPLLVRVLGYLTGSPVLSGLAISTGSFAVGLLLLHRLTELELGGSAADATVLLLAFAPLSFFFTALYTESLFLALSVGAVYAARRERWALAGALGGLASVTRITGILLLIPLTLLYLRDNRRTDRTAAWIALLPVALLAWLASLAARGFGLLSPVTEQTRIAHGHRLSGPIETLSAAVGGASSGLHAILQGVAPVYDRSIGGPFPTGTESVVLLLVLLLAAIALAAVLTRLPPAYGGYAAAALLACIWSPVAGQPLASLDRYTLTIFPLWMAAGALLAARGLARPVVMLSAAGLVFWTFQFATWAFVA